jgi:hypothetical protein
VPTHAGCGLMQDTVCDAGSGGDRDMNFVTVGSGIVRHP